MKKIPLVLIAALIFCRTLCIPTIAATTEPLGPDGCYTSFVTPHDLEYVELDDDARPGGVLCAF